MEVDSLHHLSNSGNDIAYMTDVMYMQLKLRVSKIAVCTSTSLSRRRMRMRCLSSFISSSDSSSSDVLLPQDCVRSDVSHFICSNTLISTSEIPKWAFS